MMSRGISSHVIRHVRKISEKRLLTSSYNSAWNNSASTGRIFMKFDIGVFYEKRIIERIQVLLNLTRIACTVHEDQYRSLSHLAQFFLELKLFPTKVVEEIKTTKSKQRNQNKIKRTKSKQNQKNKIKRTKSKQNQNNKIKTKSKQQNQKNKIKTKSKQQNQNKIKRTKSKQNQNKIKTHFVLSFFKLCPLWNNVEK